MDIKAYLTEQGVSEADQATLIANPAYVKAISSAVERWEEGNAAKSEAERLRQEAAEKESNVKGWWEGEGKQSILDADTRSAAAEAERSRYQSYLKSLKDQGYPVPDEYLGGAPSVNPSPAIPSPAPRPGATYDPQKTALEMAQATANLMDLNNEYISLYGSPMPGFATALQEAQSAHKPLTQYVREKFGFEGKRKERDAAEAKKREDAIRADERAKALAEAAAKQNPNVAPAIASRAAKVTEIHKDNADAWKTRKGREEARGDRLKRFENVS